MPRKKKQPEYIQLPQVAGEVWEVGRRPLPISDAERDSASESTDFLFVIQTDDTGGVVYGQPAVSELSTEDSANLLVEAVQHAMREPMIGDPRRPSRIQVTTPAEAEALNASLAEADIAVEVATKLDHLDALSDQLTQMIDGVNRDYRTQSIQAGESLPDEALRALFKLSQAFYRKAVWEDYDDSILFHITLNPTEGPSKELYTILIGQMGEEFGLAVYDSLDHLEQMYDMDIDDFEPIPPNLTNGHGVDTDDSDYFDSADRAAAMMSIPSTCLTFSERQNTPAPLIEEAKQLKLPLSNRSTYPVILRTGQLGMQVATASELSDIYVAIQAVLAMDAYLESDEGDDDEEEEAYLTLEQPEIDNFLPAMQVEVELIDNPFAPDDIFDDDFEVSEEDDDVDIEALFDSMQTMLSGLSDNASAPPKRSLTSTVKPTEPADPKTTQVYTLCVYLIGGPIDDNDAEEEISRRILILGHQTLHDLHEAIFEAFEREEEHLYEFNLGSSPQDHSQVYFYQGPLEREDDDETGDPVITTLDDLDLAPKRRFGYTFDMGDQWEHLIEVVSTKTGAGKGTYPRLGKKVGAAPPQYPDDEDELD